MKFKELSQTDRDLIVRSYKNCEKKGGSKRELQKQLADHFGVTKRSIRDWAKRLEVGVMTKNVVSPTRVLIYDIETSQIPTKVWWTGKQYVAPQRLKGEAKIITVAWKWLGDDIIHYETWDKNHCDKALVEKFLKEYNKADMVVGYNNDKFDNRWINARAMKYGMDVNTYVRSFDIMKESKRLFRIPSYSLAYICNYLDVTQKQSHEGIHMWDMIEEGTPEQQSEYLQKMVDYNVGDIISTEEVYLKLRKYMGHKVHFGTLHGDEKFTSPVTGSDNVELYKRTATPAGTVQVVMKCLDSNTKFKITNKQYMSFLDKKMGRGNYVN